MSMERSGVRMSAFTMSTQDTIHRLKRGDFMKKGIIIFVSFIIFAIFILAGYRMIKTQFMDEDEYGEEENLLPREREAYVLREKYPTDIIWYGEFIPFEEGYEVTARFPEEVSEEELQKRAGFQYVYIVVNDFDGDMELTKDDYALICEKVSNDEQYNFIYVGREQIELLEELGYAPEGAGNEDDQMFSLFHQKNGFLAPCFITSNVELEKEEILYTVLDEIVCCIEH